MLCEIPYITIGSAAGQANLRNDSPADQGVEFHPTRELVETIVFARCPDDPILKQIPAMLNGDPQHNLFLLPTPDFEKLHRAFLDAFQQVLQGKLEPKAALDQVVALWNEELDAVKK